MKLLHLTCDFMVYKDYKIGLRFIFPICRIDIRIQHLTSSLISRHVTIHQNISLKSLHASFLIKSSINFWSYTFWSMTCCFWISSKHTMQAGVSEPKIISLYLVMVSLIASSSSSLVFIQFRQGILTFFASSNRDILFIYY